MEGTGIGWIKFSTLAPFGKVSKKARHPEDTWVAGSEND